MWSEVCSDEKGYILSFTQLIKESIKRYLFILSWVISLPVGTIFIRDSILAISSICIGTFKCVLLRSRFDNYAWALAKTAHFSENNATKQLNPSLSVSALMTLIDFTLSNAKRFYSSCFVSLSPYLFIFFMCLFSYLNLSISKSTYANRAFEILLGIFSLIFRILSNRFCQRPTFSTFSEN